METQAKSRRQIQVEQTKLSIFNAAVALLGEKEFEDITIRDIVSRADVSIGTFYHYYATKMEVFYETYQIADRYFNDVVAPQLTHPSTLDRILCFFDYYARYSSDLTDRKMTRLLFNPDNPWFNRPAQGSMAGVLIEVLAHGLETGELTSRGDTVEELADYLMICIRGLIYNWCTKNGDYNLAAATQKFILRLIEPYLL